MSDLWQYESKRKIIQMCFSPDYGDGEVDEDLDPCYLEAQRAGEFGVDCFSLFRDCDRGEGLLDLISLLDF